MLWHWSRGYATCIVFFAASLTGAGSKPNLESLELLNEIDALEQRLADAKATYEHLNDEAYDDRRLHDVSENDEGHEFFENKTYSEGVCNNTEWCATKKDAEEIHEIGSELTFALSIVLFVEASIALLFITKWKDPEVRKSVFRMLSTTVSIFCAVMINHLVSAAFLYQFLPCPRLDLEKKQFGLDLGRDIEFKESKQFPCGRATEDVAIRFNIILFGFYHVAFQSLAAYFRPQDWNNKRMAFAVSNLGAHLEGFAAVAAFGEIQHTWWGPQAWPVRAILFVVFVWIGFICLKIFSYVTREHCRNCRYEVGHKVMEATASVEAADLLFEQENTNDSRARLIMPETLDKYYTLDATREEDLNEWRHCIEEREDDSAGVCIGFLIMQLVQLWVFGSFGMVEEETGRTFNEAERDDFWLRGTCLLAVVLICAVTIRVAIKSRTLKWEDTFLKRILVRGSCGLHSVVGMSFGWAFFKTGDWFWRTMFNDLLNPEVYDKARHRPTETIILLARMTNACCLSALCVFFVICIEFLRKAIRKRKLSMKEKGFRSINPFGRLCCDGGGHEKDIIKAFGEARVAEDEKHFKAHEEALHELVATAGFVVGICWEKAITQANEMLNKSVYNLASATNHHRAQFEGKHRTFGGVVDAIVDHPIFWKFYIVFIVGFIIVIWYKYLVPYVCIPVHEHIYLQSAEEFVTEGQVDPTVRLVHEALYQVRHTAIERTRARCQVCLAKEYACCGHENGLRNDGCEDCKAADQEIQDIIKKQMEQFESKLAKQKSEGKASPREPQPSLWGCFSKSGCRVGQRTWSTEH